MTTPQSISQDEARSRAALLEVDRLDLELDLTGLLEGDALRALSRIRFRCHEEGADTFVDCLAEVEEATLNGVALPTGTFEGGRLPLTGLRADNELVVRSVQRQTGQAQGVHRSVDAADGEVYVWTCFCPDDARRVFACFDQPDLKTVFGISAVAPARWTVTSNSGRPSVTDADGGTRRWSFADTPPLSTYLPVVNAGPFHEVRSTRGGYDLGLFCRRSLRAMLDRDAEEIFDLTARGLAFYADKFAMPFPQPSYDQVFVADFGGAMENYGCVTVTDYLLFPHEPSHTERELRTMVLLHEMAHMWFGDIVTMRWWDDLWLNESFAEWAAYWSSTQCTEFTDAWATALVNAKTLAYAADRAPTTHPIRQPIPDAETAAGIFDAITYPKGAAALKQLVALVGEDVFVGALAGHFAEHAWGSATIFDLVAALERAAGRDLGDWVATWLEQAGTDTVRVERTGERAVLVTEPPTGRAALRHRLDVGVYVDRAGALVRDRTLTLELDGTPRTLGDLPDEAVLLVNDGDHSFVSVVPDVVSRAALVGRPGDLPTALARTLAVTGTWDRLAHGDATAAEVVTGALHVLERETADSVVEPLLRLVVQAADSWSPPAERDDLLAAVADLCVGLADRPGREVPALRALAATAGTGAHFDLLTARATGADLGWRRLTRLAELGAYDAAEAQRLRSEDPNPEAWVSELTARAAQPDAAVKDEVWSTVFVDRKVGPIELGALGTAFWRPGQHDLLASYAEAFLDTLPGLGEAGLLMAGSLVMGMFPTAGVDRAYLDRLPVACDHPKVPSAIRKAVLERADRVDRMLVARGARRT